MQFGQLERELLEDTLWPLYQTTSPSPVYSVTTLEGDQGQQPQTVDGQPQTQPPQTGNHRLSNSTLPLLSHDL